MSPGLEAGRRTAGVPDRNDATVDRTLGARDHPVCRTNHTRLSAEAAQQVMAWTVAPGRQNVAATLSGATGAHAVGGMSGSASPSMDGT